MIMTHFFHRRCGGKVFHAEQMFSRTQVLIWLHILNIPLWQMKIIFAVYQVTKAGGSTWRPPENIRHVQVYHKACFSCGNCKRPLDRLTLATTSYLSIQWTFWKSNSNKCWLLSIFSVSACDTPEKDIFCRGCYGSSKNIQSFTFWKLKLYFQSSCREENDQQELITRKEIRGKGLRICWGCGRPSNWRLVRK